MDTKNTYFVVLDEMKVHEVSVPGRVEYEIKATENEVKEIEGLFTLMKNDTKEGLLYLFRPFNEKEVDGEREDYNTHLLEVYRQINQLGTEKTKKQLKELDLFD